MQAAEKLFMIKIEDCPKMVNSTIIARALRDYLESGYKVQEVFSAVNFEDDAE